MKFSVELDKVLTTGLSKFSETTDTYKIYFEKAESPEEQSLVSAMYKELAEQMAKMSDTIKTYGERLKSGNV